MWRSLSNVWVSTSPNCRRASVKKCAGRHSTLYRGVDSIDCLKLFLSLQITSRCLTRRAKHTSSASAQGRAPAQHASRTMYEGSTGSLTEYAEHYLAHSTPGAVYAAQFMLSCHLGKRLRLCLEAHCAHSLRRVSRARHKRRRLTGSQDAGPLPKQRRTASGKRMQASSVHRRDPNEQLMAAASRGNAGIAQASAALQAGADVNHWEPSMGRSPLHACCAAGGTAMLQVLLAHGADLFAADNEGVTPLMLACRHAHREVVEALLEAGADAYATDIAGNSPLLEASARGCPGCISALVEQGAADVHYVNEKADGDHALLAAARGGHVAALRKLVSFGAKVNRTNTLGRTALWEAAAAGHLEAVGYTLSQHPKHIRDFVEELSPLQAAQRAGHGRIVSVLAADLARAADAAVRVLQAEGKQRRSTQAQHPPARRPEKQVVEAAVHTAVAAAAAVVVH